MALLDFKQYSIRKKLLVVLIPMVLTVCLAVSAFAVTVCYRFLKRNTDRYLSTTAQGLITNIDLQLERIEKDSLLLLQNAETAQLLKEAEVEAPAYMEIRANLGRYFINFQLAHPEVESIYLWDNHLAAVSTLPSSISEEEMADYTAMADLGKGRAIWLVPIKSSLGNTVIPVVRRVNDAYTLRPIGTLVLYVKQGAFASIATDFSPPLDGEIFIANTDGVSIFSSADSPPAEEGNRRDRPRAFHDVEYFSDYTNWVYTYRVANRTIYEELIHSTVLIVCCCALVLCASFYGILRFSGHISRRLSSFSEEVQQIQLGRQDLEVTCDGNDEITALGAVFNRMIRTQNQSILHEQELQRMQHESELRALQTEINPHFLYNTLEAINWIARQHGVEQISRMTGLLAGIMRYSLSKQKRLSSVGDEVEQIRRYLELQQMRFGEKLQYTVDIAADALCCGIPRLTLQPLVENALVHGLSGMVGEWRIQIRGHVAGDCVRLAVCDNGCGMTPQQLEDITQGVARPESASIGLHNVDRRIRLMYGEPYGLTFASEMGAGVTVTVSLPWKGNGDV